MTGPPKKTPSRIVVAGQRTATQPYPVMDRDSSTHVDHDRLSIARLILMRTKELELRERVAPRLRGTRKTENAAEIAKLTKGIAELHRNGLKRLRRWRTAAEKADGA